MLLFNRLYSVTFCVWIRPCWRWKGEQVCAWIKPIFKYWTEFLVCFFVLSEIREDIRRVWSFSDGVVNAELHVFQQAQKKIERFWVDFWAYWNVSCLYFVHTVSSKASGIVLFASFYPYCFFKSCKCGVLSILCQTRVRQRVKVPYQCVEAERDEMPKENYIWFNSHHISPVILNTMYVGLADAKNDWHCSCFCTFNKCLCIVEGWLSVVYVDRKWTAMSAIIFQWCISATYFLRCIFDGRCSFRYCWGMF